MARFGILLWNQASDWQSCEDAARRLDEPASNRLWACGCLDATPARRALRRRALERWINEPGMVDAA